MPPLPEWVAPVFTPAPKAGDDALIVAARERAGRGEANRRIGALSRWYDCLRKQYAGDKCDA